jgi:pyruvate dehydrogenase E2 component (dihydrolipoamide acetyltransferase)
MLHGFLGDMFSWKYCIVPLSRYGRVYAIDLPGHGNSKALWHGGTDEIIDWLEDAMYALKLTKCHLIAHSFGGWVSLQSAMRLQDRFSSFSLIACAGLDDQINFPSLHSALAFDSDSSALNFAECLSGQSGEEVKRIARNHQFMLRNPERRSHLQAMLEAMMMSVSKSNSNRINWSIISAPIKFFWSRNDNIIPLPSLQAFPVNADITITEEGGHIQHILMPKWLTQEIGHFLSFIKNK